MPVAPAVLICFWNCGIVGMSDQMPTGDLKMPTIFSAHFDGKVLVPDEPVVLPVGERLEVRVDSANAPPGQFSELASFAADLPGSLGDLAAQHDHYLYGTPKK